ncbi:alpha/beta fold hydrolase [Streptomyces aurantiacus]|uniref:Alpha/beta hydrolase n=1 Tax=Streptomyces aurantiacus TaxID=47760 RepID=A0A7G1PEL5_9ACTN|nr:alpha/beta hydrolase [Streptomyces aurantiacus]BCL32544.1 alpha/beta hydrolase [Streptomyces aurantiacus]
MTAHRRRTVSTKTKALTVALTAVATAAVAVPAITTAQAEPPAHVRSSAAHTVKSDVQDRHPDAACYEVQVPVSVKKIGRAHIYGELCRPRQPTRTSKTVQLLVPGSTYNHSYYDMPVKSARYSYVSKALADGFSTFDIDRLATGRSTLPPSSQYTLDSGTEAIHQVITKLRAGEIKNRAFDKVVWVGHSLGSSMAWSQAAKYDDDVDAFVLTGMSHVVRDEEPSDEGPGEDVQFEIRAMDDPKFHGRISDPGYLTTNAGMRQFFYYVPNADPAVIEADERLKDVSTAADSDSANLPPAQSPSRSIKVPTLLVVGDKDQYCTPGTCTPESMLANERPYYSDKAGLKAVVVPDSGHDVQLHKNAPDTNAKILTWIKDAVS